MALTGVTIPERSIRFGGCQLNASSFELRRGQRTVKLERIPLQVLLMLIDQHDKVVTREAIADQIWGKGVFLDVDNGINTAIRKIRQVLKDNPKSPRFVETIAGTGYRFIASLEPTDGPVLVAKPAHHEVALPVDVNQIEASRVRVCDAELPRDGRWATERLSSRRFDIPKPRTSLVGREQEVLHAAKLLLDPHVRLLSFIGPGGSGKSRMAIAVAQGTAEAFKGGVQFIGLSAITNPELVGDAIVKALNLLNVANRGIPRLICDQLQSGGPLLLVLDNFEQVLSAAQTVSEILAQCPFVKAVVTTRASLKIYGEQEFSVSPLMTSAAVQLFEQRSIAVRPKFSITPENRIAIEAICHRLDGLPLAIELAAARTKVLSPAAILDRLQSRLELLTGGASDLPERQKTLRRTIDWSYDLLSEEEKRLFWRFSAFVGGATIEAAEAVCDTRRDLGMNVFDGLTSLLDKNLIQRVDQNESEPRFTMLETIREYALERLTLSREGTSTQRSHAAYCMVLAEEGNPELDPIARTEWLARCDAETDNFRSALDWLLENHELEWAIRLSMALFRFWDMREHFIEGRTHLKNLLQLIENGYVKERARICHFLGSLATSQGEYESAVAFLKQSLALYGELDDQWGIAASWNALAIATRDRGNFEEAESYFEKSLAYWRKLPDAISTARCLHNLANAAKMRCDFSRATTAQAEATSIFRELGDTSGAAWSINQSGDLELEQDRIESAHDLYREALDVFRKTDDRWGSARSLADLGYIHCIRGEFAAAREAYREATELFVELGHRRGIARTLEGQACVAAANGNAIRALILEAAADRLRSQIGAPLPGSDRARLTQQLRSAGEILQSTEGKLAWQRGSEMPIESAIHFALEEPDLIA
jgi:predicted ATPase/DNA-binding winged helix-turn-helix (wHTH) protein/Flp pilus assembly protein TadD